MAGYLLTSRIIAAGLSAVFLLIGIMNFINTMVVSVNTRKHEFATLESIGMTKKKCIALGRRVLLEYFFPTACHTGNSDIYSNILSI